MIGEARYNMVMTNPESDTSIVDLLETINFAGTYTELDETSSSRPLPSAVRAPQSAPTINHAAATIVRTS
ncbi:MAG: hypothetical protein HC794_07960 [Nitrospiraceae bacterium]|nr:hypothetical protein [Nitrospiraceae bacterium]